MGALPRVSIVVPVYNGAKTIDMCLTSLLEQDYPTDRYEVIVVENCSTDNTAEVVDQYPVRLVRSTQRGPAPARNLGIKHSDADIVAFTDADCIAATNWLRSLVEPYADPLVGATGGPILAFESPERSTIELFSDEHSPLVNYISGDHEFLPHLYTSNASYRRSLLVQIGAFNSSLVTADDVDLSWRLQLQTGHKVAFASNAIIYHRHRATLDGLKRQYRQYGFGEVLLDTMYGSYPGYPRSRGFQFRRIAGQIRAMARYCPSVLLWQIRFRSGRASRYQAAVPGLWLLIEGSNVLGKVDALITTRGMRNLNRLDRGDSDGFLDRLYQR
jgi:glycosyltransferase involved in cell wall biosynthesis